MLDFIEDKGLVIYNSSVGSGRIQNNMTKIMSPPLRAKENFWPPLACKMKKFDPPTYNVKVSTYAIRRFFSSP